ncbi:MAG: ferredoxin [bacterium]|nr:ferredoxin [bacterium]
MSKELYIDPGECTGCEYCIDALPGVFRINSEGISEVHNSTGAGEDEIQEVIEGCPAECIYWKK